MHKSLNATVTFGMVNVPVGVTPGASDKTISFSTLHRKCGQPVKTFKECQTCGDHHLTDADTVKGYKVAKNQYVTFEPDLIEGLKAERSPAIRIERFVRFKEIDPILFLKTYHLTPPEREVFAKPYVLLMQAMEREGLAGVGSASPWGKEYPCVVYVRDGLLALNTLWCHDEVRDASDGKQYVEGVRISQAEAELADTLLRQMTQPFDMLQLRSESRTRIENVIDEAIRGETPQIIEPEPEPEATTDLLAGLRASIEAATPAKPKRKRTTAKA